MYLTCQQLFYNKYVNKSAQVTETKQAALIQGSLTHALLESRLLNKPIDLFAPSLLSDWLTDVCGLEVADSHSNMLTGNGIHIDALLEYAEAVVPLLTRCMPKYELEDKLRTREGLPLSDPLLYPSMEFKQELAKLNIYKLTSEINVSAARQHSDYSLNNIDVAGIVAKSFTWANQFTYAPDFAMTIAVELDLNLSSPAPIELLPGLPWRGFIDWVYRDLNGDVVIVDHKTNKDVPNELEVQHHEQLNIYAALYYEIFGIWPAKLGIQHLRSDTLVTASTDPTVASNIYRYYQQIASEIISKQSNSIWLREPASKTYAGTCVKKFGRTVSVCPLLGNCWPLFNPAAIS